MVFSPSSYVSILTEVLDREQNFWRCTHREVLKFGCYKGKSKFFGCYIGNFLKDICLVLYMY